MYFNFCTHSFFKLFSRMPHSLKEHFIAKSKNYSSLLKGEKGMYSFDSVFLIIKNSSLSFVLNPWLNKYELFRAQLTDQKYFLNKAHA